MNVKVTSAMLATLMACTLIQPSKAVQPQVSEPAVVEQLGSADELMAVVWPGRPQRTSSTPRALACILTPSHC